MKRTPLYERHQSLGAKMAPFAGWLMPIQYQGILEEHHLTRNQATLFDTCHMGEILISGTLEESGLDKVVTQNLKGLPIGRCAYGFMLNEQGGIIDDLIVYKLATDKWMLVVNAGPLEKDLKHLQNHIKTEIKDVSFQTAKLDLQGPLSRKILSQWVADIERLKYYHFGTFKLAGEEILISRTGYTGELGFEFYLPANKAVWLWDLILGNPLVKPAGLGARDTLRLEMGYPLYGQDLTEETSPLEAALERFVDFSKDFIGKDALLRQKKSGIVRKLVGFVAESRRAPRHGYDIFIGDQKVGMVTSGSFAPTLGHGIGMGYIKTEFAQEGQPLLIQHGRITIKATIAKKPFYHQGSLLS